MLRVEAMGDRECALAADYNETFELESPHVVHDQRYAAVLSEAVVARRAEDRPATRKNPSDGSPIEGHRISFRKPTKAVANADNLVALRDRPTDDRADRCVEAWAVAATGEDAERAHDQ